MEDFRTYTLDEDPARELRRALTNPINIVLALLCWAAVIGVVIGGATLLRS